MQIKQIYDFLNALSPFELQEKWDNSGLLVGNMNDEIKQVCFALDITEEMIEKCEAKSLIITHHPIIFSSIKQLNFDTQASKAIRAMIKKDIALIAMHTNFDKTHLNAYVAKEILGLDVENKDENEYVCYAKVNQTFETFFKHVQEKLNLEYKKVVKCDEMVYRVGIVTGAGMSMLSNIQADCFLTSDIKYHEAMEAHAKGISVIDIGHYESEKFFTPLMMGLCEEYLKKNKLQAIMLDLKNPFMFH
jgi:dinuclear metal center YbgI/SA1388 family protein